MYARHCTLSYFNHIAINGGSPPHTEYPDLYYQLYPFSKLNFQLSTEYNTNIDGDIIYARNCSKHIVNFTSSDSQTTTMGTVQASQKCWQCSNFWSGCWLYRNIRYMTLYKAIYAVAVIDYTSTFFKNFNPMR